MPLEYLDNSENMAAVANMGNQMQNTAYTIARQRMFQQRMMQDAYFRQQQLMIQHQQLQQQAVLNQARMALMGSQAGQADATAASTRSKMNEAKAMTGNAIGMAGAVRRGAPSNVINAFGTRIAGTSPTATAGLMQHNVPAVATSRNTLTGETYTAPAAPFNPQQAPGASMNLSKAILGMAASGDLQADDPLVQAARITAQQAMGGHGSASTNRIRSIREILPNNPVQPDQP